MNSWDDKNFVAAMERTDRKKIVLSGLWTETCVGLPTVQAIQDNYKVYVVEDCCGDVSQLARENAMKRMIQAWAKPVTSLSVMLEWQRDWAERDEYDAVMDNESHYGAYGASVECAHHGTRSSGDEAPRIHRSAPWSLITYWDIALLLTIKEARMPADIMLHNAKIAMNGPG
jgi:nicotinamidase-related amidase